MSLLLLLLTLACAPRAAGQEPAARAAAWSRYTYAGEEFSVELPAMPGVFHTTRVVRQTPYDSDKMRVFGVYHGGVVYMVAAYDRPRALETDDRFTGYVSGGHGLTPTGEARLGGLRGREYEVGGNFKGKARVFRTEHHAYFLKAFSDADGHGAAIERFLGSFALSPKPAGALIAEDLPAATNEWPKVTPAAGAGGPGIGTGSGIGSGIGPGRANNTGGGAVPPAAVPPPAVSEETLRLARGRGGDAAGDGPFKSGELSRKALIVYKPEPGYTEEARRNNLTGVVRMRAVLTSTGRLTNISIVKGLPDGLTEKAVRAARHILFLPAIKDGREVSQFVVLEYNFNIY